MVLLVRTTQDLRLEMVRLEMVLARTTQDLRLEMVLRTTHVQDLRLEMVLVWTTQDLRLEMVLLRTTQDLRLEMVLPWTTQDLRLEMALLSAASAAQVLLSGVQAQLVPKPRCLSSNHCSQKELATLTGNQSPFRP